MAKLVVVSDLHLDKDTLGIRRMPEVRRALAQAVKHAKTIQADAFLFLGDLTDPDSGGATSEAQAAAIDAAHELANSEIESIWIPGNHDVHEDGTGATTLTPLAAISEWTGRRVHVAEKPCLVSVTDDLEILCLPYVPIARSYDPAKVAAHLLGQTRAAGYAARGIKVIVAAHLMIPGIVPGEETAEMPRGRDVMFPLAETVDCAGRMNGHYHRQQSFDPCDGGPPIIIPGAPAAFTFGEQDNVPSFLVIEV